MYVNRAKLIFVSPLARRRIAETMRKDTALSSRVHRRLKVQLEEIASKEDRSLSQVCEVLLRGGLEAYKKEGATYFHNLLLTRKGRAATD